ncbi:hypothetical protein [Rhodococcus aetherivorans]|uniref:hypothetical protein n=1 Tax=Rhodococcus aetherivorans TaxID=191292 RepID=UPI00388DE03B
MGIRDTSARLATDSTRLVTDSTRLVADTANATTSLAGAVGGAALGGVVGSVRGAVGGVRTGLSKGAGSTPAAAATLAALGVTGLVDWPVLAAVGGGALAVKLLTPHRPTARVQSGTATAAAPTRSSTQPKDAATTAPKAVPAPATARPR